MQGKSIEGMAFRGNALDPWWPTSWCGCRWRAWCWRDGPSWACCAGAARVLRQRAIALSGQNTMPVTISGLLFAAITITWIFSGLMSMNCGRCSATPLRQRSAYAGMGRPLGRPMAANAAFTAAGVATRSDRRPARRPELARNAGQDRCWRAARARRKCCRPPCHAFTPLTKLLRQAATLLLPGATLREVLARRTRSLLRDGRRCAGVDTGAAPAAAVR